MSDLQTLRDTLDTLGAVRSEIQITGYMITRDNLPSLTKIGVIVSGSCFLFGPTYNFIGTYNPRKGYYEPRIQETHKPESENITGGEQIQLCEAMA